MMRHLIGRLRRLGLLALAVVVSLYGCGGSSSDISGDRSGRATSPETVALRRAPANTTTDAHRSMLNENERHPTEEPAWLTAECDDPDPSVRLQAIEAWAREPEETLDPLIYALVHPDETVRASAGTVGGGAGTERVRETGVQ
jgi:hypothetical protein